MESSEQGDNKSESSIGTLGPELGVAGLLMALALLVLADSLRVGIGWGDDGPRSGYFPFYIGLILLAASGWVLVTTWLKRRTGTEPFATRGQLGSVWKVAWPMALYVVAMIFAGLYVSSAALIAWFMRRHGRYGWTLAGAVSVGVPLLCFFVFEKWFLVPLPKGPLEAWLGL